MSPFIAIVVAGGIVIGLGVLILRLVRRGPSAAAHARGPQVAQRTDGAIADVLEDQPDGPRR